MTYSERIKELRKAHGLSQAEMGEKIGFSKATVGMWEVGNRRPTIDALDRMSQLFDRSVDYILGKEDTAEPKSKDSDYLALCSVGDEIYDLFKKYLYASPDGKEVIENVINGVWRMCVEAGTTIPEAYQPFKTFVGFKDEIAEREKNAPHDHELDSVPVEDEFQPISDEEAEKIMKRFKK